MGFWDWVNSIFGSGETGRSPESPPPTRDARRDGNAEVARPDIEPTEPTRPVAPARKSHATAKATPARGPKAAEASPTARPPASSPPPPRPSATAPTGNVARGGPGPARRYHIGLDWGTSSTKLVLRDYGAPGAQQGLAYVLEPHGRGLRYPSTVTLDGDRLYFGWEAEERRGSGSSRVWDSLKARAGARGGWADPAGVDGVQLRALVTFSLAHSIAVAVTFAQAHAALVRATPRVGLTLGAPEADLEVRSDEYLAAIQTGNRLAQRLAFDPQGQGLQRCMDALGSVRAALGPEMDRSDAARKRWLRPEVAAAMMWLYTSPRIAEGPYTVVDIGAATTNASFFRIHGGHDPDGAWRPKSAMSFFGAESRPPGMDEVGAAVALARGAGESPVELRGREKELMGGVKGHAAVRARSDEIFETWAQARRNSWRKAPKTDLWEGMRYLVVGGGSTVPQLAGRFSDLPGYLKGRVKDYQALHDPGRPGDLRAFPDARVVGNPRPYTQPHTFLLVAYGLSFHAGDLPEISLPGEVSPYRDIPFTREFVDSEALGYDT